MRGNVHPVVLDLDGSVGKLPGEQRIVLHAWQERVRLACPDRALHELRAVVDRARPRSPGPFFLGSGDFHHLSLMLLRRISCTIDVVVLDNHPDNMRYPFGVHCGSWVHHAVRLPWVRHVDVLGITSSDVSGRHAWENHLGALRRNRLTYWCVGVDTRWAAWAGLNDCIRSFDTPRAMVESFVERRSRAATQVYVSIDKDVFGPEVVRTNWDQGLLTESQARDALLPLAGSVIGSDVTGEVSLVQYSSRWKRLLLALEPQPAVDPGQVTAWHERQHALNLRLSGLLGSLHR
jgi:hypothetical protein